MARAEPTVLCETPTPGKQGTRIAKWKYDAVRKAILLAVPASRQGMEFRQMADEVAELLPAAERAKLGSLLWYVVTVKLDLEVRGELERVPDSKPQRLRRKRVARLAAER